MEALNGVRQNFVAHTLEKLNAPPPLINRFMARAGMAPATKTVVVDTAPAVARALGIRSDHFPLVAFGAALAADLGGFAVLLRELRALARDLTPRPAPRPPRVDAAPGPESPAAPA